MGKQQNIEQKIDDLYRKKAQLDAQIGALLARKHLQRKKDMDRLIWLIGTLVCDQLYKEPKLEEWVFRELPKRFSKQDEERGQELMENLSFQIRQDELP
ncbi:MAG: hypothetical protein ACSHWZ_19320 [Sulfitobacter sp.]